MWLRRWLFAILYVRRSHEEPGCSGTLKNGPILPIAKQDKRESALLRFAKKDVFFTCPKGFRENPLLRKPVRLEVRRSTQMNDRSFESLETPSQTTNLLVEV